MILYPRADTSPPPEGAEDVAIDVGGAAIGARFYTFDAAFPTILYFHGNGEVASDHDDISRFYEQARVNLFVAEFRGYGRSTGTPTFAALVGDAHPVVERFHALLDERGFAEPRFVMGRSLGSHPALEIAANGSARMRGLIIESGAANLRRLLGFLGAGTAQGDAEALAEAHEAKIRSITIPTLIIHGARDELIPLNHAVELHDMLDGIERELVVIPNAGHNDILWLGYREYFAALGAFVARNAG